jgi:hypothetical protein
VLVLQPHPPTASATAAARVNVIFVIRVLHVLLVAMAASLVSRIDMRCQISGRGARIARRADREY